MTIPNATLRAMIESFHGFDLTDDELDRIRPELETYLRELDALRELDLSAVMSARLLRAREGGRG